MLQIRRAVSAANAVVLAHSSNDDVQCQVARILYADATANGRLSQVSVTCLLREMDGPLLRNTASLVP